MVTEDAGAVDRAEREAGEAGGYQKGRVEKEEELTLRMQVCLCRRVKLSFSSHGV